MPAWLYRPTTGPLSDTFADHAARRPGYQFCGQDHGWHTVDDWPIYASHDGTVDVRFDRDYGNHIVITADGFETLYAHLESVAVRSGVPVTAGQRIGLMGSSGNAKGIHLHHELRVGGVQVDPAPLYVTTVPESEEDDMAKPIGIFYINEAGAAVSATYDSSSGFFTAWEADNDYNLAIAKAMGFDFVKVTRAHFEQIDADCAKVRGDALIAALSR